MRSFKSRIKLCSLFETITILNKVFVREFYRLNAGFFLLIITLTFGFMSGVEHKALAQFFISSPQLMLFPTFVWFIYLIKIISFNNQRIGMLENVFIFNLHLLPVPAKFMATFGMMAAQFIPAILYGVFLVVMALKFGFIFSAVHSILSLVLLTAVGSFLFILTIQRGCTDKKISSIKKFLDYKYTKPLIQFYIEWLIRREPLLCLGTKIFSCVFLFAVAKLYEAEPYDSRLMAMGIVIAFSANMMIIQQLHEFEHLHFSWLRNLPLTLTNRFLNSLTVFILICFPEIVFIVKYFPVNLSVMEMTSVILLGISIGIFLYTLLLVDLGKENFSRAVFLYLITLILLILFKVPAFALTVINLTIGVVIFKSRYYKYQYTGADDERIE